MKHKHINRLRKSPQIFRRLTGVTPEKFDEILKKLKPLYERWNEDRLKGRNRKRAPGGGNKFTLSPEEKLLMLLIYCRTYVTHAFLAFIFGIDDSNVGRNINPLHILLAKIFRIPEKKIEINKDEIMEILFDGTEQKMQRPCKGQKKWYSGKKKHHTVKHQVAVIKKKKKKGGGKKKKRRLRIASVSKAFPGSVHDKKIYDSVKAKSPPGIPRKGDSGYMGTDMQIPFKKTKGIDLTEKQKRYNHKHSSSRVAVEHGIGKMKIWKILSDRYRNRLKNHTIIMKNIAGLHNMMFA